MEAIGTRQADFVRANHQAIGVAKIRSRIVVSPASLRVTNTVSTLS
jgi:hypothetical protein